MSTLTFTYRGVVPSKSNYRKAGKNWRKRWERIRIFEEEVGMLALVAGAKKRDLDLPKAVHICAINLGAPHWPDVDGLCKAVLDALEGVCYKTDAQVWTLEVKKMKDEISPGPRLEVTVSSWRSSED